MYFMHLMHLMQLCSQGSASQQPVQWAARHWTGKLLLLSDRNKVCKTAVAGVQLRESMRKSWTCQAGAEVGRGADGSSAHLELLSGSSALAKKAAGAFMAWRLPTTAWTLQKLH